MMEMPSYTNDERTDLTVLRDTLVLKGEFHNEMIAMDHQRVKTRGWGRRLEQLMWRRQRRKMKERKREKVGGGTMCLKS
jgi:hypothetical protein